MRRWLPILVLLLLSGAANAKARFAPRDEMIREADAIAVVEITRVDKASVKRGWTYSEAATARVERVLKGQLPATIRIHGGEDFICASTHYKPGRILVFLRRVGPLYVSANWHLGVRPITGGTVEWYARAGDPYTMKPLPLSRAFSDVQTVMERQPARRVSRP
jgi:hypothetical protein